MSGNVESNEGVSVEGGRGRKKDRRERRKRGPLERKRTDDDQDEETPDQDDTPDNCAPHDNNEDVCDDPPSTATDLPPDPEPTEEGQGNSNFARNENDENVTKEIKNTQETQSSKFEVALCEASGTVDVSGEQESTPLTFVDPEDDGEDAFCFI